MELLVLEGFFSERRFEDCWAIDAGKYVWELLIRELSAGWVKAARVSAADRIIWS